MKTLLLSWRTYLICIALAVSLPSVSQIIKVKLTPEFTNGLESRPKTRSADGYVTYGIKPLDSLNRALHVSRMERVFPYNARFDERHRKHGLHQWYKLELKDPGYSSMQCASIFEKCGFVLYAEPELEKTFNDEYEPGPGGELSLSETREVLTTNDPLLSQQWHYNNTGQTGGTPGADISLIEAWDIQQGSDDVVVAIIDGGLDVNHQDLAGAMWINEAELNGVAGVDDDNNGYVDDINGYGFGDGTGDFSPHYHGVHVGGTVGAVSNNGTGVAGVAGGSGAADGARLMSCAVFGSFGSNGFDAAFVYAADNGAVIAQNSWGYTIPGVFEQSVLDAIDYFIANAGYDEFGNPFGPMQGGIVIFAAGNDNSNADYYPGYYEPVLAVASTDHNDVRSGFSNFGEWVDIAAPGSNVLSTYLNGQYDFLSGTSMACPHVSGVAALIVSEFGGLGFSPAEVRDRLQETADNIDARNPPFEGLLGSGRLNAFQALQTDNGEPPAAIADLFVTQAGAISVSLSWTATGSNGGEGRASAYDLRYSTAPIDADNFELAPLVANPPIPQAAGSPESFTIAGLSPQTTYYFALKVRNLWGNVSAISNVASTTTSDVPIIEVDPDALTAVVDAGEATTLTFTISNSGNDALDFAIPAFAVAAQQKNPTGRIDFGGGDHGKGAEDLRVGHPVLTGEGEDDGFGYRWIDSNEPGGPTFRWDDITSTGTEIFLGDDDFREVDLGFTFPFYGVEKEAIFIGSNGLLSFSSSGVSRFVNDQIPTGSVPNDIIAPFWDDLFPPLGRVHYLSQASQFIVQYTEVAFCCGGVQRNTFQVILSSNGDIKFQYLDMDDRQSATVGIENSDASEGMQIAFNTPYIENNLAILITEGSDFIAQVSPTEGTVAAGGSIDIDVQIVSEDVPQGNHEDEILILSNDPVNSEYPVHVLLHVNGIPEIGITPSELNFGEVFVGTTATATLEMTNTGTDTLVVSDVVFPADFHEGLDNPETPFYLLPGTRIDYEVAITPATADAFVGTLSVQSNAAERPQVDIALAAQGVLSPQMVLSPDSVGLALLTGQTALRDITIDNTNGGSDLHWTLALATRAQIQSASRDRSGDKVRTNLSPQESAGKEWRPAVPDPMDVFAIPYYDGFESGNLDDWELGIGHGTKMVVDDEASQGNHSFYYDNSSEGHFHGIHQNFEDDSQPETVSFSVRPGSDQLADGYFVLTDNGVDLIFFFTRRSGLFYVNGDVGGDESFEYEPNTWYQVSFRDIDWEEKHFDYYVNNELIKADISFRNSPSVNSVDQLYLYNYDQSEAWWDAINIGGNEIDWISIGAETGTVPAGADQQLELSIDAAGLNGGLYGAELRFESDDPLNPSQAIPVGLQVTGSPDITVSANSLDFGAVFVGEERTLSFTIDNDGTDVLSGTMDMDNPDYALDTDEFTLDVGEGITVDVIYTPSALEADPADLTISSNDPDESELSIDVSGAGVEPPIISVSPDSVGEGLFTGGRSSRFITLSNDGGSDLLWELTFRNRATVQNLASGPIVASRHIDDADQYARTKEQMSIQREVPAPSSEKETNAGRGRLFVLDASRGLIRELSAETGEEIRSFAPPESLSAGPDGLAYDGTYLYFTNGFGTQQVYQMDPLTGEVIDSKSFGNVSFDALAHSGEALFALDYDGDRILELGFQEGVVARSFGIGQFIGGGLTFGGSRGTLFVNNFQDVIYEVDIESQEVVNSFVPSGSIYGLGYSNTLGILFASNVSNGTVQALDPNDGSVLYALEVGSFSGIASDEGSLLTWLSALETAGVVQAGTSLDVQIDFDASGLVGGIYEAMAEISSNDPLHALVEVPIGLEVTGDADIVVDPEALEFGSVFLGNELEKVITVRNEGTDDLTVSDVTVDDAAVSVSNTSFTLGAGEETAVHVIFDPSEAGELSATLVVLSNDPDESELEISLTGMSVHPPEMGVLPTELTQALSTGDSVTQIISIENMAGAGSSTLDFSISIESEAAAAARGAKPRQRSRATIQEGVDFLEGRVLLRPADNTTSSEVVALKQEMNARHLKTYRSGAQLWSVAQNQVRALVENYAADPRLAYIEPDYVVSIIQDPNDPRYGDLWGLHNTGQTGGTDDADIDAPEAWEVTTGSDEVVVGIIDTGIDYNHLDLTDNMWVNEDEIPNNGVDDDGNGYVDDVYGWDFANNDNDPWDDHSHGTHVAGTVAASGNNGVGIVGVSWHARLMALKFLNAGGSGSTSDAIEAVDYAVANGADLTNNSWGGGGFSAALEEAIVAASNANQLFVAAAGNSSSNNDLNPHYPSSYDVENVLAVAATDHSDVLANFSSFGATTVDLAAPGVNILSTTPGNNYASFNGTSMATPHVAGAAVLVWSMSPQLSNLEVKEILMSTVDPVGTLNGLVLSGGRLNASEAVNEAGGWLSVLPIAGSVDPGGEQEVVVSFDADRLVGGDYRANLVIATNDPSTPVHTIEVNMAVTGAPVIGVDRTEIDFGQLFAGGQRSESLMVSNSGTDLLSLSNITSDNPAFSADVAQLEIAPGASAEILVTFEPGASGSFEGILSIENNDLSHAVVEIVLNGEGIEPPVMVVSPDTLGEALFTGGIATQELTIDNTGGGSDLILSIRPTLDRAPRAIPPSDHQSRPTTEGSDDTVPQRISPLSGNDPRILVIQNTSAWGLDMYDFILGEFGIESSVIGYLDLPNVDLSPYDLVITVGDEGSSYYDALSANVPRLEEYVAQGGIVQYQLATQGDNVDLVGGVVINHGSFDVSNTVLDPDHPIVEGLANQLFGNSANHCHLTELPEGTQQIVETTSTQLPTLVEYPFGLGKVIATGMTLEWLFFNSPSAAPLLRQMTAYSLEGVSPWLSVLPANDTIPAGASHTLEVTFNAAGLQGGLYEADLVIASNDPLNQEIAIPVGLQVSGAPDIVLSETSLDFGDQFVGAVVSDTIGISNQGTDLLQVTDIQVDNDAYNLSTTSFSIAVGASELLIVTYVPTELGDDEGTITISSNDADEPEVTVALDGEALPAAIMVVTPDTLGQALFTGGEATQLITIDNTSGGSELEFEIYIRSKALDQAEVLDHNGFLTDLAVPDDVDKTPLSGNSGNYSFMRAPVDREVLGADLDLEDVLLALDTGFTHVTDQIPHRFAFSDGVTGEYIPDGGWDMYDGGNYLSTDLGGFFEYTNGSLATDPALGGEAYFTAKYPGLFVFAGDTEAAGEFNITGNLGADGGGSVDGSVLSLEKNGRTFLGFVKRVYSAWDPSVNHLVIVEDNGHATHEFAVSTDDDYHRVDFVEEADRLYYLLYAGDPNVDGGFYIDDATTLAIMDAFLEVVDAGVPWLSTEVEYGQVEAGTSSEVEVAFDASGLIGGLYEATLVVASNDPLNPEEEIPVGLEVTGAPDIEVSPEAIDFGDQFIGAEAFESLVVSNLGTDVLEVADIQVDNENYTISETSFSVPVGSTYVVMIGYVPTELGIDSGVITVFSNDADEQEVTVTVIGEAVDPPVMVVSPDHLEQSLSVGEQATQQLTIDNSAGGSPLTVNLVASYDREPMALPGRNGIVQTSESTDEPETLRASPMNNDDPNVLVIQDTWAWGLSMYDFILDNFGITSTVISHWELDNHDLSPYDLVITVGDEDFFYYNTISANADRLADYVAQGGVVQYQLATQGDDVTLVGDVMVNHGSFDNSNTIVDPAHPMVEGLSGELFGNSANHCHLTGLPEDAQLIVETTSSQLPTLVEYSYGAGRVIATGMTVEWLYFNSPSAGPLLGQMTAYSLEGATGWLSVTPGEVLIPAGATQTVDVRFDASGMDPGGYVASLVLSSNDPLNREMSIPVELRVGLIPQTITFNDLADVTYGDAPFTLSATGGGSGNSVTFSSNDPTVATVVGSSLTIVGQGVTQITARQAGNDVYASAVPVVRSLLVSRKDLLVTADDVSRPYGEPNPEFTVTYVGFVGGESVEVLSSAPTVTTAATIESAIGDYDLDVSGGQADNYLLRYESGTLTIAKVAQEIEFFDLPSMTEGDDPIVLSATATSGLEVTFATSDESVASISGSTLTIVGAGGAWITAHQVGNDIFAAAPSISHILTVEADTRVESRIMIDQIDDQQKGAEPLSLTAVTRPTGAPIVWEVLSGPASVDGDQLRIGEEPGLVKVRGAIAATDNYKGSEDVIEFSVLDPVLITPLITFTLPETGLTSEELTLTATLDRQGATTINESDIAYSVVSGPGEVDGNKLTFARSGRVIVSASLAATAETNAVVSQASVTAIEVHTISGTVYRNDGEPFDNGFVIAADINDVANSQSAVLGAAGAYGFTEIREGDYEIFVTPLSTGELLTFYGNISPVLDPGAEPQVLRVSSDLTGIDIVMQTPQSAGMAFLPEDEGGIINFVARSVADGGGGRFESGRVETGDAIPNMLVILKTDADEYVAADVTNDLGLIRFTGLPTGDYRLVLDIPGLGQMMAEVSVVEGETLEITGLIDVASGAVQFTNSQQALGLGLSREDLRIYPNPTADRLMIDVPMDLPTQGISIHLYDSQGKELSSNEVTHSHHQIDMQGLPPGNYILLIGKGIEWRSEKIIKR